MIHPSHINHKIAALRAFETLDSRGNPTVSVHLALENGCCGTASVPSGASTGEMEAHERRDGDQTRYFGRGTKEVCKDIEEKIFPSIKGLCASSQRLLDERLCHIDGTENKEIFGANAILAVSVAAARAAANAYHMPLYRYIGGFCGKRRFPSPMMNILNGGCHADNNIDIQEFMIVPVGAPSFSEAIRCGCEIYHTLKDILKRRGLSVSVGDEGGFAPNLKKEDDAIEFLIEAIHAAGYDTESVKISLDAAASEWAVNDRYLLPKSKAEESASTLIEKYKSLCERYHILSIEDPLGENDENGWKKITDTLGKKVLLVGDDLFVTNKGRLAYGIHSGLANAILIKPNQIGTLTETLDTVALAQQNGYETILSHRSGETDDSLIADLSLAVGAAFLKAGAPTRGERVAKYNRLIKLEQMTMFVSKSSDAQYYDKGRRLKP